MISKNSEIQSDKSRLRVAIVIPTFNEVQNISELIRRLVELRIVNMRLVVVDDGSLDGTADIAVEVGHQLGTEVELIQRYKKLGLGTAYVAGFKTALRNSDYVVQMDADLSHRPEDLPRLLDNLRDADVVVGSRYVPGGSVDKSWSIFRRFLSYAGNLGIRLVSGVEVMDITSGFKAFRTSSLQKIDLDKFQCRGFAFQSEMAHVCQQKGFRVVESPIIFNDRTKGKSKMSFHIVVEAVWRMFLVRWRRDA